MEIDIRNPLDVEITKLKFADGEYINRVSCSDMVIEIETAGGDLVEIYMRDIDNLIKALQKAKELWAK